MKTTIAILTLALTSSVLPSQGSPSDAATEKSGASFTLLFDHQTSIVLPADPARTMEVTCNGSADRDTKTGVATFLGNVKVVLTAPGQTPVTITGENLTLTHPQ